MRVIFAVLLAGLGALVPVSLSAWDEGYISLTVPVQTEAPLTIEPDLSVRMLQVLPPGQASFRVSDGVIFARRVKVSFSYLTNQRELSGELSGWIPVGPFAAGASAELIWADNPGAAGSRYWSGAATLFGSGWIVPDFLNAALNVQYDMFSRRLNTGLGVSVSVVPGKLSIVAEASVSPIGTLAFAWDAGALVKTAGHQFLFYLGNGNDLRMRSILASTPDATALSFGITVRRRIDVFFKSRAP